MKHDECRNTHSFKNSGQNLGLEMQSHTYMQTVTSFHRAIKAWFNEYKKCPPSILTSFRRYKINYGHFTQIAQDTASHVGCAAVKYLDKDWFKIYMVCDYSHDNILGEPVYTEGWPCSQCKGMCGTKFKGLCLQTKNQHDEQLVIDDPTQTDLPNDILVTVKPENNNDKIQVVIQPIGFPTSKSENSSEQFQPNNTLQIFIQPIFSPTLQSDNSTFDVFGKKITKLKTVSGYFRIKIDL